MFRRDSHQEPMCHNSRNRAVGHSDVMHCAGSRISESSNPKRPASHFAYANEVDPKPGFLQYESTTFVRKVLVFATFGTTAAL